MTERVRILLERIVAGSPNDKVGQIQREAKDIITRYHRQVRAARAVMNRVPKGQLKFPHEIIPHE